MARNKNKRLRIPPLRSSAARRGMVAYLLTEVIPRWCRPDPRCCTWSFANIFRSPFSESLSTAATYPHREILPLILICQMKSLVVILRPKPINMPSSFDEVGPRTEVSHFCCANAEPDDNDGRRREPAAAAPGNTTRLTHSWAGVDDGCCCYTQPA